MRISLPAVYPSKVERHDNEQLKFGDSAHRFLRGRLYPLPANRLVLRANTYSDALCALPCSSL